MTKTPEPVKVVTRQSGEVVKVVMRQEDDGLYDEEDLWLSSPENDDDWDSYWAAGDDASTFGPPLSLTEEARGSKRTFDFMN